MEWAEELESAYGSINHPEDGVLDADEKVIGISYGRTTGEVSARSSLLIMTATEQGLRFGTFIPQGWRMDLFGIDPAEHWSTMSTLAMRADAGPWESIWVYDHFHTVPVPTQDATHEAWTLMAAFAASTSRVRLGQMCTCMAYRNPAYLAKVAATVDIVSGGRTEMGIGAGW